MPSARTALHGRALGRLPEADAGKRRALGEVLEPERGDPLELLRHGPRPVDDGLVPPQQLLERILEHRLVERPLVAEMVDQGCTPDLDLRRDVLEPGGGEPNLREDGLRGCEDGEARALGPGTELLDPGHWAPGLPARRQAVNQFWLEKCSGCRVAVCDLRICATAGRTATNTMAGARVR